MKTAIVYYSMCGNTKFTADKIAEKVNADLIRLEPVKAYPNQGIRKFFWGGKSAVMGERPELRPYEFRAEQYDRILLGTPVWAGSFAPPLGTFIRENKEALTDKEISVFVCFSGGGADKAIDKLKKYMGIRAFKAELILIDPKEKATSENDAKIAEFCKNF